MEEQPFIIKLILGFIVVGLSILLIMGLIVSTMFSAPEEEILLTKQGDTLLITLYKGAPQVVSIRDPDSKGAALPSFDLTFNASDFKDINELADSLAFIKRQNNCSYYEIDGEFFVVYSPYSPHIITEDGHWYQIRYIDTWDRFHNRNNGVRLYIVEYAYENDQASSIIDFTEVGCLKNYPEVSEYDLIERFEHPIRDLEELKEQITTSPLLEFESVVKEKIPSNSYSQKN